jgi:hypothetical protein
MESQRLETKYYAMRAYVVVNSSQYICETSLKRMDSLTLTPGEVASTLPLPIGLRDLVNWHVWASEKHACCQGLRSGYCAGSQGPALNLVCEATGLELSFGWSG